MKDEGGASAVEFALVAPVFLMLVIGIFAFGLYLGTAHCVQQLAAEAARASVAGLSPAERSSLAQGLVTNSLPSYTLLDPAALSLAVNADPADANLINIDLSYDTSGMGIWAFERLLPLPPKMIHRGAVIRRGGY
ncbi:TadE/TadG family type IV pilus assembly protein [Terrihabitans rhizophilus]|uniref:TadE/TadG family type IV pilus assembly protein n=1 Tax=Terrihabitans rhizophilus TaxID=3092662 RepID=A0ABU4RPZ4_9HYPH|nr:TadE/TadG family type IV pilus assembly protein [Terrihabitans sp. PJ23]MDX6806918.1 TadE/TadG family type IV pilus assembly protein [Terrihabitans sp. PJ23]